MRSSPGVPVSSCVDLEPLRSRATLSQSFKVGGRRAVITGRRSAFTVTPRLLCDALALLAVSADHGSDTT